MDDWVPFFAIAMFAEDMRIEPAGTTSLISILPDTVVLPELPAALPHLHVYVRIAYSPANPPRSVSCGLRIDDRAALLTQHLDTPELQRVVADAVATDAKIGTIVARIHATDIAFDQACLLNATVTWNDEEFVVGTLMIQ